MEAETMLKRLHAVFDGMDIGWTAAKELAKFYIDLEAEVRTKAAKSKGAGDAFKVIEKMLTKGAQCRPALCGAWVDKEGRQCSVDGFRAYRLKEHLPLTALKEGVEPIRLHEVFQPAMDRENVTIPTPDFRDVKAHIAIEKANSEYKPNGIIWDFGPGLPAVNAVYLLEMLTVFPDAVLHIPEEGAKNRLWQAVYVTSEKGDGLILPIRVASKEVVVDLDRDTGAGHAGEERDTGKPHSDELE